MSDSPKTPITPNVNDKRDKMPWWSRPVVGEGSLVEQLRSKISKPEVPENILVLHNREMMDAKFFANTAQAIDNEKFSNREFLLFVRLKYCIAKGIEEFEGLDISVKLLQAAIEAKNSFLTIDQAELRYRSSKQQEFYQYVESLLKNHEDKAVFSTKVQEKLVEVIPHIKTEEGKIALQSYAKELDNLSKHELGLKLLSLFKAHQLADYSILRIISDMANSLREQNIIDYKNLVVLVTSQYEVFDKLKNIIGVSSKQSNPETYARMIQYIALNSRYQKSFVQFAELISVLQKWIRPSQAMISIHQQYPATEYKLPKQFSEPIPGMEIYDKYKKALTNQKTGYTYIDFGEQ